MGLGKTGTILLRRSARLLALVQDMGSIPIRRYSEEALAGLASFRGLDDELGEFVVHSLVPFLCVAEICVAEICTVSAGLAATASVGIAARRERLGS